MFQAEISGDAYVLRFSGGARGLARIFSDAETSATVSGTLAADRLQPVAYDHVWTEDGERETVTMRFSGRRLASMTLDPPRRHPERYVPFTPESKADVLDLVSAFLWPFGELGEGTCVRTLPLVDGRRRFDITLAPARLAKFATRDGSFQAEVAVCEFRYTPVAGQRIGKPDNSILNAENAEVWIAPVGDGFAIPARVQLRSRVGRIVLEAVSITAN
jgi:hypothetical protein